MSTETKKPFVMGFIGRSGSGKTTLAAAVLRILAARGWRVCAVKDAHHHIDLDTPGKDTWRYRESGASCVILRTPERWAVLTETPEGAPGIDELLKEEIHGLILSPYNDPAIQEKIDLLWENGIPCITINTDMPDSKRIAYVGSDYHKCGQTAAGLLHLFSGDYASVGIVTGSHNVLCHEERISGFTSHLHTKHPNIRIVDVVENGDDDYKSYEVVSDLLDRHPDLSALYFTAAGVYGGCRAVLNASLQRPLKIITFDAVLSTCEMIRNGVISATICQQPDEQGARSLSLLVDYLLTGKLPENRCIYMDLSIKIAENL